MRSTLHRFALVVFFFLSGSLFAQQSTTTSTGCPGIPGACGYPANSSSTQRNGPAPSPQNGNQTLGQTYNFSKCGLNFTTASQRLGRRGSLNGVIQPAPFVITGIPVCATIEKAYLWAEGSGNGLAQTATIVNPALVSTAFPMTIIGQGPDKCWGYSGSYTYRADVTSCISGNGTYTISGILTNPPTAGNDMDGATLMVIWSDPTATYRGTMVIHDGAMVVNGGTTTQVVTGMGVCQTSATATAFCMVGDIQLVGQTLTMNGTPAPFTWNWWNYVAVPTTVTIGQNTANFTLSSGGDCFNLCVIGMYYRTTNCTVCPSAAPVTVTSTNTPATCSNCNGSATVSVAPSGSYTYAWSPNVSTSATATNLCAGTYTVTISNACFTQTTTVTVPAVGGSLNLTGSETNVLCNGQCNGTALTTATTGNGPFTYSWSPTAANSTVGNTNTASNLCAGVYTVNVSDANGCSGSRTVTITQPQVLAMTQAVSHTSCGFSNGSITMTPSGGTPTYNWVWTPNVSTTNTATNLAAPGPYICQVTDANGCVETNTVTLIDFPGPTAQINGFTDVTCFGGSDGTASVTVVSGGSPPFTYAWSTGGTGATETNMPAGVHTVTVTDILGCVSTVTVTISEPPQLVLTSSQIDVLCFGGNTGSATVSATGGSPTYTYLWSTTGTNPTEANLTAGNYSCVVTDTHGCTATMSYVITEPPAISLAMSSTGEHCGQLDGTVGVIATGGSPTYQYLWQPGNLAQQNGSGLPANLYSVTVTDNNGCTATDTVSVANLSGVIATLASSTNVVCYGDCNGSATVVASGGNNPVYTYAWSSSANTNATETNMCGGAYTCIVTDGDGCTATVNVNILQPAQLTVTVTAPPWPSICTGSSASLFSLANGGSPGYTYSWAPGPIPGNNPTVTPTSTTMYTVTVTDNNGCTAEDSMRVTVNPVPVADLTANITSGCVPLNINFSDISTVTSPGNIVSWAWDFGDGNTSTQQNPSYTYTIAGSYNITLVVTTADGCSHTITLNNYINAFPVPTAAFTAGPQPTTILSPNISFTDQSTNASSWNWSFGDLVNSSSTDQNPIFTYPSSGCYEVVLTVTSSDGCTDMASDTVCIDPDVTLYVPNAFSPNGDGVNDFFFAQGIGIPHDQFEMWIFDRWGNLIYYIDDMNKGWDGTVQGSNRLCQIDSYVWKIKALDELGKNHVLIGHVSIVK